MAEITTRSLKNDRTVLKDVVPIDTPFLLGIFLGDICNFKCKYCIQSADEDTEEKKLLVRNFLEWDTFLKIADSAKQFPKKLKTVLLTSIGEPLLHPELISMLTYMHQIDLADAYEIITNASVLTPELGRKLVDAGLTRLCVSLQGLTAQKYKEVCGVEIDYREFYDNLKSFYEYSRGKCKVHVKTVDISLESGEDKRFMEMYKPICDTIYIDKIAPVFKGVDYSDMLQDANPYTEDQYRKHARVCCSSIFYTLYTLADGRIAPCCDHPQPLTYGSIHDISLAEAWNSDRRKHFLLQHLSHRRCENGICAQCAAPLVREFDSDKLDGYEEEIIKKIEGGICSK
ncbi:MAG: radical SAM protein [Clostridiaceae bacterium]|nr:radical SAM protein [Clostridiaceae bacterium]